MLDVFIDGQSVSFGVSDAAKQALRDQVIDEDGPGTILRDFDTLLEFVGEEGLQTTGKYYFLPQSKLDQLNSVMSHPVVHRLKRPQQRSFPHLHGLYLLLRASGMGTGVGSPPGGRLTLESETVYQWRALNATERYFALLESWLVQASPEVIAERGGWSSGYFHSLIGLAQRLQKRRTLGHAHRGGVLYDTMTLMTAALMEMFGWVRLEYGEPAAGEGIKVKVVQRLALGDAMVSALNAHYFTEGWPAYHDDQAAEAGLLRSLFQPYFPEYRQALVPKEWPYRDGLYTWHVSLPGAWRRITAPDDATLDELAMTVLDAFDFDADHLYCFELSHANGRKLRIACPQENDAAAFTDETALGDVQIAAGGVMTMIFDYGDWWKFRIKLEKVGPAEKKTRGHRIVAKGGKPPAQYDWDEDEEDEYED